MALSLQVEQVINSYNLQITATSDTYAELGIKLGIYDEVAAELILEFNPTWDPEVYKSGETYILELTGPYANLTVTAYPDPENVDEADPPVPLETLVEEEDVIVKEYKIQVDWSWDSGNSENPNGNVIISGITNRNSVTLTGTSTNTDFHKTYGLSDDDENYYINNIPVGQPGASAWWIEYNAGDNVYFLNFNGDPYFNSNDLLTWFAEDGIGSEFLPAPTGTLTNGNIEGIMGWGNPNNTQWSDLNGTYIKTSSAVRPSGYYSGNSGMNTPEPGTFNYYLQTPDPTFNGIAYILAPGNTSGWFSNPADPYTDPAVNFWRLCVGSDYPKCYFTNPSTDATVFPTTGWVLVDDTLDTNEGGDGYNYISSYDSGFTANVTSTSLDSGVTYTYSPGSLTLNNNACPVNPNFIPSIDYKVYKLVNKVWVETEESDNFNLSTWQDGTSSVEDIDISFETQGFPIKIITTITNCNEVVTYDTYVDGGYLITSADALNLKAQVQTKSSYTIRFSYTFQDATHPNLIITPENNAQCNVIIYKNEQVIYVYEALEPGQNFSYTFDEATKENVAEYKVVYYSFNPDFPEEEIFDENIFVVREYKPTFNLPTIACKQVNEFASIALDQLNFNCYSEDTDLHLTPFLFTPNIRYKLYYFNEETYEWDLDIDTDAPTLNQHVATYLLENPGATDFNISEELQNKFYFGSDSVDDPLWKPEKLAMAKLIVEVKNYSTEIIKEVIFPICGSWKVRRMSCGSYRLYNYTANPANFTLINLKTEAVVKILESFPFSYITFDILEDGVYKIVGIGTERYIFNFCAIENCVLELQKKVLLDDTLCDACKLDKVLYQKALRLIPIYETWKKLLDKDGVYEIQYLTTDVDKNLEEIYSADELYAELKLLCDQCTNDSGSKKCKC